MRINNNISNYHKNEICFKGQIGWESGLSLIEKPELKDIFYQIKKQTPKGLMTLISERAGVIKLTPMRNPESRPEFVGNFVEMKIQDSIDFFRYQAKQYLKQFRALDGRFSTYHNYMKKINS